MYRIHGTNIVCSGLFQSPLRKCGGGLDKSEDLQCGFQGILKSRKSYGLDVSEEWNVHEARLDVRRGKIDGVMGGVGCL